MSWLDIANLVLTVLKWISPLIVAGATIYAVYLCVTGFLPVLIRLGNGLNRRKIAIFAKAGALESLSALLSDTKLFNTKNIIRIADRGDFGRAEDASVFLVHWPDWQEEMQEILRHKRDQTALVIYAPQGQGFVPPDVITHLEQHRNIVLANLRGRLLNDVVVSLITTAYEKK